MRERLSLEGKVFGDFIVIAFNGVKNNRSFWTCKCTKCGAEKVYAGPWLKFKKEVRCRACYAAVRTDKYHKYSGKKKYGVPYKKVLPPEQWPKVEAFCRVVAFLKRHAKQAERRQVSLEAIKAAVNSLLEAR